MRRLLLLTATLFAGLVLSADSYCPESTSCCSGFSEKGSLPADGTCPAILDKDGNNPPTCPYGSLPGWSGPTPPAVCTEKGTRFTFDTKTQTDYCGQKPKGSLTIKLVGDNVVITWDTAGLPYGDFSATVSGSQILDPPGSHLYKSEIGSPYCPPVTYPAVPTCTIPLAKFLQDAGVTTCDPKTPSNIYVAAHLNIDPSGSKDTCWAGDKGDWPRLYFPLTIKCVEYCKSYCCCAPPPPPEPCPSTEVPFCGTGSCPTDKCNTNTHSVNHWGKPYQDTCCCTPSAPSCNQGTCNSESASCSSLTPNAPPVNGCQLLCLKDCQDNPIVSSTTCTCCCEGTGSGNCPAGTTECDGAKCSSDVAGCTLTTVGINSCTKDEFKKCCCKANPAPACSGDTPRDCTPASKMRIRSLFGDVKFAQAQSLEKRTFTCSKGTPSCPTDACTGQALDTGCKCCCPPETKKCSDTAYPNPGSYGGNLNSLIVAGKPCTTAWGSYIKLADKASTGSLNFVAGAGQNDWSKGTIVGTVTVSRDGQCVNINVDMTGSYSTGKYHINVSCGLANAAGLGSNCRTPGKYNYPSGCNPSDPYSKQICLSGCNDDIIVIIHGEILKEVPLTDTSCSAYTCS